MGKWLAGGLLASTAAALAVTVLVAVPGDAQAASAVEEGKAIAFDRKKGNCLACHMITGGNLPGNMGPPLIAMKARFPDKEVLRAQIYDATVKNPNSLMPPFGRNGVLSKDELDKVVEYIHTP